MKLTIDHYVIVINAMLLISHSKDLQLCIVVYEYTCEIILKECMYVMRASQCCVWFKLLS